MNKEERFLHLLNLNEIKILNDHLDEDQLLNLNVKSVKKVSGLSDVAPFYHFDKDEMVFSCVNQDLNRDSDTIRLYRLRDNVRINIDLFLGTYKEMNLYVIDSDRTFKYSGSFSTKILIKITS